MSSKISKNLALGSIWLVLVGAGLAVLMNYEYTPGVSTKAPERWPGDVPLKMSHGVPTLVMFVHPRCPCTRASISQLAVLITRHRGKLNAYVFIFQNPNTRTDDWSKTDVWNSAIAIPGVNVFIDNDGARAAAFNAQTSGQTYLYDTHGWLVFSGGITPARGQIGPSDGLKNLEAALAAIPSGASHKLTSRVFGCPFRKQPR